MMDLSSDVYFRLHGKLSAKAARVCVLLAMLGAALTAGQQKLPPHSSMHRTALHKTARPSKSTR